jgi:DNA polymerase I
MSATFDVPADEHRAAIEIESYAPQVFVPAKDAVTRDPEEGVKKRYIEWVTWDDDDGEVDYVDVTGLEYERSDVAPVTKDVQWEFAQQVLREDESAAVEALFPYLRDVVASVRTGEAELDDVCKRKGLGKPLDSYGSPDKRPWPIYRGAKYVNQTFDDVTIQQGDKPRLVYVEDVLGGRRPPSSAETPADSPLDRGETYPSTYTATTAEDGDRVDALAVPDASIVDERTFRIDYEKHAEKTVLDPLEPLLETWGYSWDDVLSGTEDATLDSFC